MPSGAGENGGIEASGSTGGQIKGGAVKIIVYRSQEEPLFTATHHLRNFVNPAKDTMVIGDINYGANEENDFSRYLAREGFTQLVKLPTHIRGGIWFIAVMNPLQ